MPSELEVSITNTRIMWGELVTFYSHPSCKTDEWVVETLNGMRDGYFVECGAYNGVHHSDTLTLENFYGWRGMLIEPNPHTFRELRHYRKNAVLVPNAVAPFEGEADFYIAGAWSGLAQYATPEQINEYQARHKQIERVRTIQLATLLAAAPPIIDYFSLDTEGSELEILTDYFSNDTERFPKFRLMSVEFNYDWTKLRRLQQLLNPFGYECVFLRGWDSCWRNVTL